MLLWKLRGRRLYELWIRCVVQFLRISSPQYRSRVMFCQEKLLQAVQEIRTSSFWIQSCKSQDPTGWFLKHRHPLMTNRHVWYQKVVACGGRGLHKHQWWINRDLATACMHIPLLQLMWGRHQWVQAFRSCHLFCYLILLFNCFLRRNTFDSQLTQHTLRDSHVGFLPYSSYSEYFKIKVDLNNGSTLISLNVFLFVHSLCVLLPFLFAKKLGSTTSIDEVRRDLLWAIPETRLLFFMFLLHRAIRTRKSITLKC